MKILIIDDHDILHVAIQHILASNWEDVAFTSMLDANEAVAHCQDVTYQLILLDLSVPTTTSGLNALLKLRQLQPSCKIVVLTAHEEELYQRLAYEYGADGFLLKAQTKEKLIPQLRRILEGERIFIDGRYEDKKDAVEERTWKSVITEREKEVLVLTVRGFTQKEIGDILNISVKTVNNHRTSIMGKLNSGRHSEWFQFAVKHKLVEL